MTWDDRWNAERTASLLGIRSMAAPEDVRKWVEEDVVFYGTGIAEKLQDGSWRRVNPTQVLVAVAEESDRKFGFPVRIPGTEQPDQNELADDAISAWLDTYQGLYEMISKLDPAVFSALKSRIVTAIKRYAREGE